MEGDVHIVQITIRDRQLRKLTAINNEIPEMLSFQNDTFHLYRENSTSTFDFTIPKWYNGKLHDDVRLINDDVYISFIDDDRHYYFYVHTLVQDDFNFILTCNDANLEYTMEQANPFVNSETHNIEWYLKSMDLLELANVRIGLNEISDITRTLSFDNQETKLERLSSLISQFGGEFDLVTEVDKNGKYSGTRLDIYHEADDTHHGVGKVRGDVTLTYGKDVKGVQVTSDKDGFFNAGIFTGADGLNITDLDKSEKDADGNEEYYTRSGSPMIYAPKSRDKYPSSFLGSDKWTRRDFSTDYKDKNELYAYALRTIKQYSMPQKTYLVSAQSDMLSNVKKLSKGDTVYIYDKNFEGGLLIKARVSEVIKSFTNPMNDTYVFSNYVLINREVSATLQARIDEILASKIPYRIVMVTSNGTSFKNGTGQSIVSPKLFKGDVEITDATYRFNFNNNTVVGLNYTVNASAVSGTSVLKIDAYVGNDVVASDELTFINVNDGLNGSNGRGITSTEDYYLVSASKTGITSATTGWVKGTPQVATATNKYHWHYHVDIYSDGARKETVPAVIGIYGDQGLKGDPGKDGQNGQIPHIAYADITEIVKQSDPEFKIGANTLTAYNNLANGNVVMERITAESDAPSNSGYMLKISNIGTASPGLGGVKFGNVVNSNEVYIYTIVAKIPIGYTIEFATNSIGNDGTRYFLTSTAGTGKYETYKYQVNVGTLSTASSSGYFFINGSQVGTVDAPTNWYIAFANYSLISANNFSIAPLNSTHIGVYVDDLPSGSTDWKKYAWTLTKGQKGDQGIPGLPGADGKTPYWHTAWANSADGKTDFSLTDPTGRKYRGEYADYTQTDSTDPTKYKWVDMTANVRTGSRNLLVNTKSMDNIPYTSANKTSETYMGGSVVSALAPSGSYKDAFRQKMSIVPDELEYIVSFYAKSTAVSHNVTCYFYSPNTTVKSVSSQGVVNDRPAGSDGSTNVNVTNEWKRYWIKWTLRAPKDDTEKIPKEVIIGRNWDSVNSVSIALPALYAGNLNTEHSEAPEDTQLKIDSKADQALTQEQLNLLLETQNLMTAEMRTKATAEQVDALIASYNKYVSDEAVNKANVEAELIANAERIEAFRKDYDDKMLQLDFVSNYMRATDLGLEVSASDGSSSLLVQKDRISMFSAGKEVMYISQGFIHIDNGVFTKTLQIGNFRESQADGDPTTNLTIYVG